MDGKVINFSVDSTETVTVKANVDKFDTDYVIEGSEITAKSMDAKGIVFVADENFIIPDNFKVSLPSIVVPVNFKAYPVGFPVEICKAVKKFTKDELFASIKKDDLFQNY